MAGPTESTLFWGLTWANIIAFFGILGNFFFTYFKDRNARSKTSQLDKYNHSVRTPIEALLTELSGLMDDADDLVRSNKLWQEQLEGAKGLKPKFHAIRRKLARRLTDCDRSKLVRGNSWALLEGTDMDSASEALERASSAASLTELREQLRRFAVSVDAFRDRLQLELDKYAASLV